MREETSSVDLSFLIICQTPQALMEISLHDQSGRAFCSSADEVLTKLLSVFVLMRDGRYPATDESFKCIEKDDREQSLSPLPVFLFE